MLVGTDAVLLCLRVDFVNDLDSGELEDACIRLDGELRGRFPVLREIFIEPASKRDTALRERVRRRYGRVLADE